MRTACLLSVLATATAFVNPSIVALRSRSIATAVSKGPSPSVSRRSEPRGRASLGLRMGKQQDPAEIDNALSSFTDLVKEVTGNKDYKFGDLSRSSLDRIDEAFETLSSGAENNLEEIITIMSKPDYQFGDVSKVAAQRVVEWGKQERKALEDVIGKEYEFGDLTKFVAKNTLGEDYQFGDLTKAAVKAAENYKFGDISRGVMKMFAGSDESKDSEIKSTAENVEAMKQALGQEQKLLTAALDKGLADGAGAGEVKELLAQEMGYLESLSAKTAENMKKEKDEA